MRNPDSAKKIITPVWPDSRAALCRNRGTRGWSLVVPRFLHSAARESGHTGVMIFFALSGFLMGYLYLAQAPTRHAIAQFLVRRGARVIPLYLVVVLACFTLFNTVPELRIWAYSIRDLGKLIEHLTMLRGFNILWTVPVEIQFYLMVPLIWLAFSKAPRATLAGLFAVIAAIYVYRAFALLPGAEQPGKILVDDIVARLAAALPYFFAGLAISRLVTPRIGGRLWDVLFVASFAGLLVSYPKVVPLAWIGGIDYWQNPLCLLLVSVLLIATLRSALADRILGSRPFRFLGRVSVRNLSAAFHRDLEPDPLQRRAPASARLHPVRLEPGDHSGGDARCQRADRTAGARRHRPLVRPPRAELAKQPA